MARLSEDQLEFLKYHGISLSCVFDASGMARREYSVVMKVKEKDFAYGVTPCKNYGHTLRSRAGKCIQCSPAAISFMRRQGKSAYVYIAGSKRSKHIKIGSSTDPNNRIYIGNLERYGGASDWTLLAKIWLKRSGEIENLVQSQLICYAVTEEYFKGDQILTSRETFRCGYYLARARLRSVLLQQGIDADIEEVPCAKDYDFGS